MPNALTQLDDLGKETQSLFSRRAGYPKEELNMLKPLLTGSYVLVLLLFGSLSAQAQVSQSTSPPSQPQVPVVPQAKISPDELQKFARSLKQLLVIQQGVKQEMAQVVGQSGLSQQRFMEIYQARKNPSTQPTTAITSQEKQNFDKTFTRLGEIQQKAQSKEQQTIQKEGLQPERFYQILMAVRQDPTLQQKVRQMIQS